METTAHAHDGVSVPGKEYPVPPIPAMVPARLKLAGQRLAEIPARLERTFLAAGERMVQVASVAGELSDVCGAATRLLDEKQVMPVVGRLEAVLDRVEQHFSISGANREQIFSNVIEMEQVMDQASSTMDRFNDNVKQFGVLRLYARIQTSMLDSDGFGFANVAGEIALLVDKIKDKSADIARDLILLREEVVKTDQLFREMRGRQGLLADEAVGEMRRCAQTLLGLNRSRGKLMGKIDTTAASVSRDIGEIVTGLQFHDIARQKMEHVVDVLKTMESQLKTGAATESLELRGDMFRLCELQVAQLRQARADLDSAMGDISQRLEGAGAAVVGVVSLLEMLVGLSISSGGSGLAEIGAAFIRVKRSLEKNSQLHQEMKERMGQVTRLTENCVAGIEMIEIIGEDIQLIALNAMVKSIQAGDRGLALSVIAQSIKSEASILNVIIGDIVGSLQKLGATAAILNRTDTTRGEGRETNADMAELEELLSVFNRQGESVDVHVKAITESMETVNREISASSTELRKPIELADLETLVIGPLEEVARNLYCRGAGKRVSSSLLEELSSRYTMNSERKIHESVIQSQMLLDDTDPSSAGDEQQQVVYDNVFLF